MHSVRRRLGSKPFCLLTFTALVGCTDGQKLIGVEETIPLGGHFEGCVPEQWREVSNRWTTTGIDRNASFDAFFGVDFFDPDVTLATALRFGLIPNPGE